jgi:hypothetical protein
MAMTPHFLTPRKCCIWWASWDPEGNTEHVALTIPLLVLRMTPSKERLCSRFRLLCKLTALSFGPDDLSELKGLKCPWQAVKQCRAFGGPFRGIAVQTFRVEELNAQ